MESGKRLSRIFKNAALAGICMGSSACANIQWDGGPGLNKESPYEPLLDHERLTPVQVEAVDASNDPPPNILIWLDSFLRKDNFSVEKLKFRSNSGEDSKAYLFKPSGGEGPYPLVVVFPILSGEQYVSELLSRQLARRGYAVLQMPGHSLQFTTTDDPEVPMEAYRNAILDARQMIDVIAERAEIDENRIGAAGISLGSLLSSTFMGVDPDVKAGAFFLTGGGLAEILYDSENGRVEKFRERMKEKEGLDSREEFLEFMRPLSIPMDPLRYAGSLDPCRILLVTGRYDKQIGHDRAQALWEEMGRPDWRIMPTHHMDIALFFYWMINKAADHFDDVLKEDVCKASAPAISMRPAAPQPG